MPRPPSVPTAEQIEAVATARGEGLPWKTAAWAAGVSDSTVLVWREKAAEDDEDGPYRLFLRAAEKARAEWVRERMAQIKKASAESWQAAAWQLERAEAQEFGRRIMEHQGKDGGPVEFRVEWQAPLGAAAADDAESEEEGA